MLVARVRSLALLQVHVSVIRMLVALGIGSLAGLLCFVIRMRNGDVGDFTWALYTAEALLQGRDPYAFTPDANNIPYPLPVAVFGLPLVWLPWQVAASVFTGLSAAWLAWHILGSGEAWRLLVFLSLPYFMALHFAQWSPLIMATWYAPLWAPLCVLIKPHIALPIALVRFRWRGCVVALLVLLASLVVDSTWPLRWSGMVRSYQQRIPLFTLPFGPLLLLTALRVHDRSAKLLGLLAMLPIRGMYDLCTLWLLPKTPRQALILTVLSWMALPLNGFHGLVQPWIVPLVYLPTVVFLLMPRSDTTPARQATRPTEVVPDLTQGNP